MLHWGHFRVDGLSFDFDDGMMDVVNNNIFDGKLSLTTTSMKASGRKLYVAAPRMASKGKCCEINWSIVKAMTMAAVRCACSALTWL